MKRREFLRRAGSLSGAALLAACTPRSAQPPASSDAPAVAVEPAEALPAATAALTPQRTAEPALAATVAATATVVAAATATLPPTLAPSATPAPVGPENWLGRVALVKAGDRADGVRRALALFGDAPLAGRNVLLKPNFNSSDVTPGSTHPDVLRTLVAWLKERGVTDITVGDRSGMGNTRQVMQSLGVFGLADELGFTPVVFDELAADEWTVIQSPGDHWSRGFAVPKLLTNAGAVVQTCNLKTHRFGGHFTLSLKNSVGFAAKQIPGQSYNYMSELHGSRDQRRMIAEINRTYQPALVVMDALEAFADGGPDRGRVIQPGVILVAADRVALDTVGVAILRHFGTTAEVSRGRVFEQEQIARAVELGLGAPRPEDVQIITEDEAGAAFAAEIRAQLD